MGKEEANLKNLVLLISPWFGSGDQSNTGEDFLGFNGNRTPTDGLQNVAGQSSEPSEPIGLTLRRTPSFESQRERLLYHRQQGDAPRQDDQGSHQDHDILGDNQSSDHPIQDNQGCSPQDNLGSVHGGPNRSRTANPGSASMPEKLKASNFPIASITIGRWQRSSRNEGDLVAKIYYAKKKLVWEVLDGPLKSKIEMPWSDICAIRATTPDNQAAAVLLEIMLDRPPSFFCETNPQPRKHTIWTQAPDFTGGVASRWRKHCVSFHPGVLDRHYDQLLQCDERLLRLSQEPFPCQGSPYFHSASCSHDVRRVPASFGSGFPPAMQYQGQAYHAAATGDLVTGNSNPPLPVVNSPYSPDRARYLHLVTRWPRVCDQGESFHLGNINQQHPSGFAALTRGSHVCSPHNHHHHSRLLSSNGVENYQLNHHHSNLQSSNDIENYQFHHHHSNLPSSNNTQNNLLGNSRIVRRDEGTLQAGNLSIWCHSLDPNISANQSRVNSHIFDPSPSHLVRNPTYDMQQFGGLNAEPTSWLRIPQVSNQSMQTTPDRVGNNDLSFVLPGNQDDEGLLSISYDVHNIQKQEGT